MEENMTDVVALTNYALAAAEHEHTCDSNAVYGNVLADSTRGMSYNWDKHMIPSEAVNYIKSCETVAEGVARVAEHGIAELYERNPEMSGLFPNQVVGVYKTIAARFGVGAAGEIFAEEWLEARGETVMPSEEGDENRGIDVRTNEGTYQVKTADEKRSDWSAKEAEHLIWVKPGEGAALLE